MARVPLDPHHDGMHSTPAPRSRGIGWAVIAGTVKLAYDIALLVLYRDVPEVVGGRRSGKPALIR